MATIQRSLLIEAPVQASYAFWCEFGRFPELVTHVPGGDAAAVAVQLIEQEQDRLLRWRLGSGPEREALITLAPLEGNATWFTFTLEYEPAAGSNDVAGRLAALARTIDRELRAAREAIEFEAAGHVERMKASCPSA